MNFTIALLAGLVLLLPGVTALSSWNFRGGAEHAKRPELQLTSTTALFIVLCVALLMHLLGYGLVSLFWSAGLELGRTLPKTVPRYPLLMNPYDMAVSLATGGPQKPTALSIFVFVLVTAFESLVSWMLAANKGLDIVLDAIDVRSQGWAFEHIVRPARHGYKPVAFVLTNSTHGDYGIGYKGVVGEVRQGDNGEMKLLTLADPQSFVYHVITVDDDGNKVEPKVEIHDGKWIGGVVLLESATIRNVVIHNIPADLLDQVKAASPDTPEDRMDQVETVESETPSERPTP